jgi:drug/metabolite transporter (DMT)-like permease
MKGGGVGVKGGGEGWVGRKGLALGAIYLIWGSTYLAIRFAIDTLPPFVMAGTRFLIAGVLLYVFARGRGAARPTRAQWRAAAIVGTLLLMGGNGAVTWAEQNVASGATALLVAMVPFWMVLLDWLRPGGQRPAGGVWVGIAVGFGGLALLVGPGHVVQGEGSALGVAALVVGTLLWATGSLLSRGLPHPDSPLLAVGMQMLVGGAVLMAAGLLSGEAGHVALHDVSTRSILALAYLVLFGSIVAYSSYVWLLRVAPPAVVSTYAYVNPIIAVFLGWLLAGETVTPRTLIAAAIIIGAVGLINVSRPRQDHG